MAQKYQGQDIKSQREAREGDVGFVKGSTDQVVITLADGTEKTVKRSEVSGAAETSEK